MACDTDEQKKFSQHGFAGARTSLRVPSDEALPDRSDKYKAHNSIKREVEDDL
jgi:hypothetical protein